MLAAWFVTLMLAFVAGAEGAASEARDVEGLTAPGRLDTTFGHDGVVRTSFGRGLNGGVREILVDARDRIVAIGSRIDHGALGRGAANPRDVALVRYLPSGALDRSFGKNGKVIHDVRGLDDVATDAAQLQDGRIVVVGATDSVPALDRQDLLVLRFLADGTLDRSFGTDGLVAADLSAATPDLDFGWGVAIQNDGRIIVAGQASLLGSQRPALAVARFLPDGRPDASFGTAGVVRVAGGPRGGGEAVFLDARGRIVVGGDLAAGTFVARLRRDGALDGSFGVAGFVRLPDGSVRAVLPAGDRGILAFGATEQPPFALVSRLDERGRPDRSFGQNGRARVPIGSAQTWAGLLAGTVQPDGKILAAGGNRDDVFVVRLSRDGRLDRTFGGTGAVTIDVGGRFEFASAVALGRGGKIVAAGDTSRDPFATVESRESLLVRLTGTGSAGTRYASIAATNLAGGVALRWTTLAEPDVRAFSVYRATSDEMSVRTRLTRTPIRARRAGPGSYVFIDRNPPDFAPLYWLEELRRDGSRALFGPVIPPQVPTSGRPGG
jgi:uncharacterized delta-60 repeat protein